MIRLLNDWGFVQHGTKTTKSGTELVFVRNFKPTFDLTNPCLTYPYFSLQTRKFIVPIKPSYHTELLPDSVLTTEKPGNFIDNGPHRNAISKVYISHSLTRNFKAGDIVVFYRSKPEGNSPAYYTSVTTTVGIVQNSVKDIPSLDRFIALCRKRSVFNDAELAEYWNEKPRNRPFILNFLYIHTFPHRLNLKELMELQIIAGAPQSFTLLKDDSFIELMENSNGNMHLIVN